MNNDEGTQAASTATSTLLTGTAFCDTSKNATIVFNTNDCEMIRIAPDGFYVRGVKLEQDEAEARKLFDAMLGFMLGREK